MFESILVTAIVVVAASYLAVRMVRMFGRTSKIGCSSCKSCQHLGGDKSTLIATIDLGVREHGKP